MTNPPAPQTDPGTPPSAAPRPKNRLAVILALGLLVAALAVGGGVWFQQHRAEADYKSRAATFHAALTKLRDDLESNQPPETVSQDWDAARAKEKEWEDHVTEAYEKNDLTDHLRAASMVYTNLVMARQKSPENGSAATRPATRPAHDDPTLVANGKLALDKAALDLKK
jgi:hypothetical protein